MQRLKAAANGAQVGGALHRTCLELQKKKERTATLLNKSLIQNQYFEVFTYSATVIMNKSAAAGSAQLLFSGTHGQHKSQVMALLDAVLRRSCPGMFTVVAVHQAHFICTLPLAGEICRHVCTAKPFGHLASGRQSSVKAILQWMCLIAHVTTMAGFSPKPCPPDQEVDPDSSTKRQTRSSWGTLVLLQ